MQCYRPIGGYYARKLNDTKKRSVVFTLADGYADRPVQLPCGKCIGCRLERARQWAVRCMHEAKLYERNCFVTLTYNEGNVPRTPSGLLTLEPRDLTLFLKKLRWRYGAGIRYFQCGEYGDRTERPHHHLLLFNHDFDDRVRHGSSESGAPLYTSRSLDNLWGFGDCSIGEATFESAGYIARYTMKKAGESWIDKSPVLDGRVPEYLTMSRRPGIGYGWCVKNHRDYYPSDQVVVNGKASRPPRYYDGVMEKISRGKMLRVKYARRKKAEEASFENAVGNNPSKFAREVVKQAAIATLARKAF